MIIIGYFMLGSIVALVIIANVWVAFKDLGFVEAVKFSIFITLIFTWIAIGVYLVIKDNVWPS